MTTKTDAVQSTAIVPYNPTLPHIAMKSRLEKVTDDVFRRSFEVAKFETSHLSPLSQKWIENVVTQTALGVSHLYIDAEMGKRMASVIMRNMRQGNYNGLANPFSFKEAVIKDIRSIYPDKHLDILCEKTPIPDFEPARSLNNIKDEDLTLEQRKYIESFEIDRPDFSKQVESYIIPNTQIGYFKFNEFPNLKFPETRGVIDHSMKKVANAEALIIDLRENTGGYPETVAFIASYLFDKTQLINQLYQRSNNEVTSFYAEPAKVGTAFGGTKPIYILTSERTFSAAEELAYDLQSAKRATVIGQTTKGGAHPIKPFVVDDHLYAIIPFRKAINPHTGTNWEGVGVKPDHLIAEEDALTHALSLLK